MVTLLRDEPPKACNNCEKKCPQQAIYYTEFNATNQINEWYAMQV